MAQSGNGAIFHNQGVSRKSTHSVGHQRSEIQMILKAEDICEQLPRDSILDVTTQHRYILIVSRPTDRSFRYVS